MRKQAQSIPCAGDKAYIQAVGVVARRRNLRMADIVRRALDTSEYATEIEKERLSFFAASDVSTHQQQPDTQEETV